MIGFDGSTLAFEENVRQTKQAVEAIKSINADIVVEGELGYIGSGSEIHDTVSFFGKRGRRSRKSSPRD